MYCSLLTEQIQGVTELSCLTHVVHPVFNVRYHPPCHQTRFKYADDDEADVSDLTIELIIYCAGQGMKGTYDLDIF